jgi:hypothetical protein
MVLLLSQACRGRCSWRALSCRTRTLLQLKLLVNTVTFRCVHHRLRTFVKEMGMSERSGVAWGNERRITKVAG